MAKKVLIIEDSYFMCQILEEALQQEGFEVSVSHDGKGGLFKAQSFKPDLVLLDLILPDMPGEEVCRDLKKSPETENTPVMMLTAKNSDVDRVVGRVLGAQAYISKPVDLGNLMAEIKKLIVAAVVFLFCFCGFRALASDTEEKQHVPEGMELIKVGEHTVYVAKGTKVTRLGAQLVLEPSDEFVARKISVLERAIDDLDKRQEEMLRQIEDLRRAVERLSPASGKEDSNGPE